MDAAGFWIAIAAIVVAITWARSRSEQMKHETIRQIVEKTGQIDEEQLRKLFHSPGHGQGDAWAQVPGPGYGYRALRILGLLTLFAAAGVAAATAIMMAISPISEDYQRFADDLWPVFPAAIGIAIFGCGLFYCSRFLPRPSANGSVRNDRN